MERMKREAGQWLLVFSIMIGVGACTSVETAETNPAEPPPPLENPEQREYLHRTYESVRPLPEDLNEQSSDINRKRNIENTAPNEPAMNPTDLRPDYVPDAPLDTTRHNVPHRIIIRE